jgi:hypothetical protein
MSKRKLYALLPYVWILLNVLIWFLFYALFLKPRVLISQQQLRNELIAILPPKQTTWSDVMIEKSKSLSVSWVRQEYTTELDARDLFAHYDTELARNSWELRHEYILTMPSPWSPFSSGKFCEYGCWRTYCKESFSASLDYQPPDRYYLSLSNDELRSCEDIEDPNKSVSERLFNLVDPLWFFSVIIGFVFLQRKFSQGTNSQEMNEPN